MDYGVRAVLPRAVDRQREGIGMAAWNQERYYERAAAGAQFPGIAWNAKDSNDAALRRSKDTLVLRDPARRLRVGRSRARGETVVRGGVGMYRYHEPQAIYASLLDLPAGVQQHVRSLRHDAGCGRGPRWRQRCRVRRQQHRRRTTTSSPLSYTWSLTLNQKLPWSMNVELGYVGNKAEQPAATTGIANYNAVPVGAMLNDPDGNENSYRPYRPTGDLNVYRHNRTRTTTRLQLLL